MIKKIIIENLDEKNLKEKDTSISRIKILSDIARKDDEKLYDLENIKGTQAYYSNRYGWSLRRNLS